MALAQIPASAYPVRRAAAMARIAGDVLIVPARASFLADDQLVFVQAGGLPVLDRARRARRSRAGAGWRVVDVEALCGRAIRC